MNSLEKALKYEFKNAEILKKALTHSSFSKEEGIPRWECNERLEFLGDSVLGLIVTQELYERMLTEKEGKLAKLKSEIVRAESLEIVANDLNLGRHLILGRGEEMCGGRRKKNILADALEAVIGGIFLDGGYQVTRKIVLKLFEQCIDDAFMGKLDTNYKSALQEIMHKRNVRNLKYTIVKEEGKSHNKVFYAAVFARSTVIGEGSGKSKKEAENNAAKAALKKIDD